MNTNHVIRFLASLILAVSASSCALPGTKEKGTLVRHSYPAFERNTVYGVAAGMTVGGAASIGYDTVSQVNDLVDAVVLTDAGKKVTATVPYREIQHVEYGTRVEVAAGLNNYLGTPYFRVLPPYGNQNPVKGRGPIGEGKPLQLTSR